MTRGTPALVTLFKSAGQLRAFGFHTIREISVTNIERLRMATEDDVKSALENASFDTWPQDEAALLEFFNRMLDTMLGETAGDGVMWPGLRRNLQ